MFSGGLDSILAAYMMKEQAAALTGLYFINPFSSGNGEELSGATAAKLGMPFLTRNLEQEYLDTVLSPEYGYGSHMNPCIDCRIFMLRRAAEMLSLPEYDFVVTGEVVGQRPMSQRTKIMEVIERESGLEGLIVRPLSARILKPSLPEERGWVSRDKFLSICGRSRKEQMGLAKKYGINENEYMTPAGGCRLTAGGFSNKFRDLVRYKKNIRIEDIKWLDKGRHFRLKAGFRMVVGRNHEENILLEEMASAAEMILRPAGINGPTCIGIGEPGVDGFHSRLDNVTAQRGHDVQRKRSCLPDQCPLRFGLRAVHGESRLPALRAVTAVVRGRPGLGARALLRMR